MVETVLFLILLIALVIVAYYIFKCKNTTKKKVKGGYVAVYDPVNGGGKSLGGGVDRNNLNLPTMKSPPPPPRKPVVKPFNPSRQYGS